MSGIDAKITALIIDAKIAAFLAGRPALKALLVFLTWALGAARAREWFAKRYEVR